MTFQGEPSCSTPPPQQVGPQTGSDSESDSERGVQETDQDRLRALLDAMKVENVIDLTEETWVDYDHDFNFNVETSKTTLDIASDDEPTCDILQSSSSRSTFTTTAPGPLKPFPSSNGKGKEKAHDTSEQRHSCHPGTAVFLSSIIQRIN